jgi:hypothetical protein
MVPPVEEGSTEVMTTVAVISTKLSSRPWDGLYAVTKLQYPRLVVAIMCNLLHYGVPPFKHFEHGPYRVLEASSQRYTRASEWHPGVHPCYHGLLDSPPHLNYMYSN